MNVNNKCMKLVTNPKQTSVIMRWCVNESWTQTKRIKRHRRDAPCCLLSLQTSVKTLDSMSPKDRPKNALVVKARKKKESVLHILKWVSTGIVQLSPSFHSVCSHSTLLPNRGITLFFFLNHTILLNLSRDNSSGLLCYHKLHSETSMDE